MYVAEILLSVDDKEDQYDPITEVFDAVVDFIEENYPDVSLVGSVHEVDDDGTGGHDAKTI